MLDQLHLLDRVIVLFSEKLRLPRKFLYTFDSVQWFATFSWLTVVQNGPFPGPSIQKTDMYLIQSSSCRLCGSICCRMWTAEYSILHSNGIDTGRHARGTSIYSVAQDSIYAFPTYSFLQFCRAPVFSFRNFGEGPSHNLVLKFNGISHAHTESENSFGCKKLFLQKERLLGMSFFQNERFFSRSSSVAFPMATRRVKI